MATPLQYGDPPLLGPFVLQARLRVGPAGLVYLGQGPDGRAVSVAVLTKGAAQDPAARDRFVTAIREAAAGRNGVRGWMTRASRSRTAVIDAAPQVLAMGGGTAPWVATPYEPDRVGAERFLEPVLVRGTLIGERHGPDFAPHWLGDRMPALPAPRVAPPAVETRMSVIIAAVVLAVLLSLLASMIWLLFRVEEEDDRFPPPAAVDGVRAHPAAGPGDAGTAAAHPLPVALRERVADARPGGGR
ncbi:hypothetical protein [Planobispora longispora]|uniref:hypothetical protein n=1 Tax=Planobispora longispora TaxID=28887 RepID=UPI00360C66DF